MRAPRSRWRHVNQFQPPKHRRLLVFAPELRGREGPMDDGVRFGFWSGKGLHAPGHTKTSRHVGVVFHRWWAYPLPPALPDQPKRVLTGEMLRALDRLEAWQRSRGWQQYAEVPHLELGIKLTTLQALWLRGFVRRGLGVYYLDTPKPRRAARGSGRGVRS